MTGIIIQARMGSTRLPGKVLRPVCGRPLLQWQLERLHRTRNVDRIIVATTVEPLDDAVVALCERLGVDCFRGSEQDVLDRYVQCAHTFHLDTVVRITADCPLADPQLIDRAVRAFRDSGSYDYVSNTLVRTYPRGLDTEVMSRQVLETAAAEAREPAEREHVTLFIYSRPDRFRLHSMTAQADHSRYRWTVDTLDDFRLMVRMLTALEPSWPNVTYEDCLRLMQLHPEWPLLNRDVEQKPITV